MNRDGIVFTQFVYKINLLIPPAELFYGKIQSIGLDIIRKLSHVQTISQIWDGKLREYQSSNEGEWIVSFQPGNTLQVGASLSL